MRLVPRSRPPRTARPGTNSEVAPACPPRLPPDVRQIATPCSGLPLMLRIKLCERGRQSIVAWRGRFAGAAPAMTDVERQSLCRRTGDVHPRIRLPIGSIEARGCDRTMGANCQAAPFARTDRRDPPCGRGSSSGASCRSERFRRGRRGSWVSSRWLRVRMALPRSRKSRPHPPRPPLQRSDVDAPGRA